MADTYKVQMRATLTLNIKADCEEDIEDWMSERTPHEVISRYAEGFYDIDYNDKIIGKTKERANVDISEQDELDDWDLDIESVSEEESVW